MAGGVDVVYPEENAELAAQIAANTVNRSGFTVLVYFSVLALFFAYCYPIARLTQRLERRYAF